MLETAREYVRRGYSVIPVGDDKKPHILWKEYQDRLPRDDELQYWFSPDKGDSQLGIVTGAVSGNLGVIDVDDMVLAKPVLATMLNGTKTVKSLTPSGGCHLWFRMPEGECLSNNSKIIPGADFRGEGGYIVAPPSKLPNGQYTFERDISEFMVEELPPAYIKYIREHGNRKAQVVVAGEMFTKGRRDEDLFHIANLLVKGGASDSVAQEVLTRLASTAQPPFPEDEVIAKLQSALGRDEKRERSVTGDITEWVKEQQGYWHVNDMQRDLSLRDKKEKATARQAVKRLVKKGSLQHHPLKAGTYRRIEVEADEVTWMGASTDTFDFVLPLGLSDLTHVYPGNIIIVAGASDAGKTALLLNMVADNMKMHSINYFTSEMGSTELRTRIEKFDIPVADWDFRCYERSSNFADVIKPDEVNIIDYLEIGDEFYAVANKIREIHDKLDKGICIIAMQKDFGRDLGRGGAFTMEKARLYLAMDKGRVKIVKCKNWATEQNPNGLIKRVDITQGCNFEESSEWRME